MTRSGALYYVSSSTITNVYIAELDAKLNAAAAPSLASDRWINSNHAPVWSPDGQHLAYYSQRPPVVRIRSVKTGEDSALPTKIPMNGPVRWFPDGHSVLTTSRDPRTGQAGYYRVDTASGNAELLHRIKGLTGYTMFPDLSTDGKTIFSVDCAMNCDAATFKLKLMRFDIDSRRETELRRASEPGAGALHSLAVSPDGAQLAYLRGGFNKALLEVMPAGGGEPREVFRYKRNWPRVGLAWTPDQRYLLFVRPESDENWGTQLLWRVPVTGGEPENMGISMHMIGHPRVHPDGRRIAFSAMIRPSPELWALENFLPSAQTKKTTASRR